jgi:uncharacterized flavoprotein (TIGR03862 family)
VVSQSSFHCAILGAGPAGLIAAETLAKQGVRVTVYDRMPNPARKFLMAGRGGLNLTHSEPRVSFLSRYGDAASFMAPMLETFSPKALRAWCDGLGEESFVGSSGRVFPKSFKASPLLRAWLQRLQSLGVEFKLRHEWCVLSDDGTMLFRTPDGAQHHVRADAVLLALGGASWPRLGADGGWVPLFRARNIPVTPLVASNVGVTVNWSPVLVERFAGSALKRLVIRCGDHVAKGEAIITAEGLEGGAIYALGPALRDSLEATGQAQVLLDLRRDLTEDDLVKKLSEPRGKKSVSTWLLKAAGLSPASIALLREAGLGGEGHMLKDVRAVARLIKALPITVTGMAGLHRAISTAGGIARDAVNDALMLKALPGYFVAGEMLDWDAPTGGYLLQASFSTGFVAANGSFKIRTASCRALSRALERALTMDCIN